MSSCSVDETKDHVTIHYLDGRTYTYKDCSIDCFVDWKDSVLNLIVEGGTKVKRKFLTSDTMCVEQRDSEGVMIWKNPKYKLSVKTDVMTAKQRAKKNQKDKEVRIKQLAEVCNLVYGEGYDKGFQDSMEQLGYIHVGNLGEEDEN